MSDLKDQYKLSQYKKIYNLGSKTNYATDLVIQENSGKLYVMKTMDLSKAPIYECLLRSPHPNLVKIFEVIRTSQTCITIEEYIGGYTLNHILNENRTLQADVVNNYIIQLCMALKHIHRLNIVHRDIQPNNILVSTDGYVKLIDFDISRTPKQGRSKDTTVLGTVGYAAPEQFGFSQTDARADIYSLGVLMNVMLTGHLPNEQLYPDSVFRKIIIRCTSIDVRNRYQSADQLLYSLPSASLPDNKPPLPEKIISKVSPEPILHQWKTKQNILKEKYKLHEDAPAALKILRSIPGFRSGFPWKMIISLLIYPLMLFIIIEFIMDLLPFPFIYQLRQIFNLALNMLLPYILWTNLGNIDQRFPLLRSMDKKQARFLCIGIGIVCLMIGSALQSDLLEYLGLSQSSK